MSPLAPSPLCKPFRTFHPPSRQSQRERLLSTTGWPKANTTHMTYTAEIRRVGGSLYKATRGSSNLFLPDTCFSNTVRPVWA